LAQDPPAVARERVLPEPEAPPARFRVVPERSVVLIEARSTVGPIRFGAMGLTGTIEVAMRDGEVCFDSRPSAALSIPVDQLRSGNGLYDAELLRRIDARRFPRVSLNLEDCTSIGTGDRYRLAGQVTFHGITRPLRGTVGVKLLSARKLVVTGDHALDVRDFQLPSPTVLMLRIYPDVRVNLHVEAELED
jgi:polyisoprenoid-binding protein YceI